MSGTGTNKWFNSWLSLLTEKKVVKKNKKKSIFKIQTF